MFLCTWSRALRSTKGNQKCIRGFQGIWWAYACKLSFQRGHEGNVSFLSKTNLIDHYEKTLDAFHFGGRIMIIETKAALKLLNKYFKEQLNEKGKKRIGCGCYRWTRAADQKRIKPLSRTA